MDREKRLRDEAAKGKWQERVVWGVIVLALIAIWVIDIIFLIRGR